MALSCCVFEKSSSLTSFSAILEKGSCGVVPNQSPHISSSLFRRSTLALQSIKYANSPPRAKKRLSWSNLFSPRSFHIKALLIGYKNLDVQDRKSTRLNSSH